MRVCLLDLKECKLSSLSVLRSIANYDDSLIVLAVYSLCIGHPGLVFSERAGLSPADQSGDMERQNGMEKRSDGSN